MKKSGRIIGSIVLFVTSAIVFFGIPHLLLNLGRLPLATWMLAGVALCVHASCYFFMAHNRSMVKAIAEAAFTVICSAVFWGFLFFLSNFDLCMSFAGHRPLAAVGILLGWGGGVFAMHRLNLYSLHYRNK